MPARIAPANASVPLRSPLRYPGGKTWLIPQVRRWLGAQPRRPEVLVEPFLGGGSVSLCAAAEDLATRVVMVELDPHVADVWDAIVNGGAEGLANRIRAFTCDEASVRLELASTGQDRADRAFRTIVRNRVQRGGILAPGAGLMRAGEAGKGIASRWYPQTLARRSMDITVYADKLTFIHGDAFTVFAEHLDDPSAVFFVDPPYTAGGKNAGHRLYEQSSLDHDRLFAMCAHAAGDVLMTYDNTDEVKDLAATHGLAYRPVARRRASPAPASELLIGKDLSWAL